MALPERVQAGRNAGDAAGRDPDGVVDELAAERHLQLEQLRLAALPAETGHGDEAVDGRRTGAGRVVIDAVAAAEQAGHDGLGDARRETGGNRGVRRRTAVGQDLRAGGGGRGMPCSYRLHRSIFAPSLAFPVVSGRWRILLAVAGVAAAALLFVLIRGEDEKPVGTPPPATGTVRRPLPPPAPQVIVVPINTETITRATIPRDRQVVLVISGAAGEEVHLHGYDVKRRIGPNGTVRLPFRATIPGRFEVELEANHRQVADLTVR